MPIIQGKNKTSILKDTLTENSVIEENAKWENDIYLIAEQDYVHGGKDGYDNVPHQQLANRTKFLKSEIDNVKSSFDILKTKIETTDDSNAQQFLEIRNIATNLRSDIDALIQRCDAKDAENTALLTALRIDVDKLIEDMKTHTHNYAGSDSAGGDANTVKITKDLEAKALLVGASGEHPNELIRNENVYIQNNELTATKFIGELEGVANFSKRLSSKSVVSFYGDVVASYMFDGSDPNLQVKATLASNGVQKGVYGNNANRQMAMSETFVVPKFRVNEKGLVESVEDVSITLPNEAMSGTANATHKDAKLYLIGGEHQAPKEFTYTNRKVYINEGKLYSNDKEVINTSDTQSLTNKTYEGYKLNEACAFDVDLSIQGIDQSTKLITSNAMYNHVHNYAGSDTSGGSAKTVEITQNNTDKRYIVTNQSGTGKLEYNTNVSIEHNNLSSPVIHATDMLHIPGGRLWIDTSVNAIDGSGFNPQTIKDINYLKEEVNKIKNGISIGSSKHKSLMATGVTCSEGDILYYSVGGYRKADNKNPQTAINIVMALTDSDKKGNVETVQSETRVLDTLEHDGKTVYLGENGQITFTAPKKAGTVVKVLGFMERNTFVFNAFGMTMINK